MKPRSITSASALCVAVALLGVGCGAVSSAPTAGADSEEATDTCDGVALAQVLPGARSVAGHPLVSMDCSDIGVAAFYGTQNGDEQLGCSINLADTDFRDPQGSAALGMDGLFKQNRHLLKEMFKANVAIIAEARSMYEREPIALEARGGPSTLPVVATMPTGETWVVNVPDKYSEPTVSPLMSQLKNRYNLTVECSESVRTHDHAQTLYAPWAGALNLRALP